MFCSSSKRAFSSTTAVTDLPASAAAISALMTADCLPARYNVCLIATTSGSAAACRRKAITTSNVSYGWWTTMSFARIAAKQSPPNSRMRSGKRGE